MIAVDVARAPLTDALALGPASWDAVCERSGCTSPFMSWAWHRAWADTAPALEANASEVLTIHDAGDYLDAMLPIRRCRLRFRRRWVQALTWAIGDVGCPDELDVPALPDADVEALADALDEPPWHVLVLPNLAQGAPNAAGVAPPRVAGELGRLPRELERQSAADRAAQRAQPVSHARRDHRRLRRCDHQQRVDASPRVARPALERRGRLSGSAYGRAPAPIRRRDGPPGTALAQHARHRRQAGSRVVRVHVGRRRLLLSGRPRSRLAARERRARAHGRDDPARDRAGLQGVRLLARRRRIQVRLGAGAVHNRGARRIPRRVEWSLATAARCGGVIPPAGQRRERGVTTLLIVSLDTEEDNWHRSRDGVTVENIRELPRQARFFERLGVRPTYFTTYQVAIDPCGADVRREGGGHRPA